MITEFRFNSEIHASTVAYDPCLVSSAILTLGVYPMIRSYGDLRVATFGHWLCANSAIGKPHVPIVLSFVAQNCKVLF